MRYRSPTAGKRPIAFLLIYALANAGGVIGYLPLLSLLLPLKIEEVASDVRLGLFTATVIAGAISASLTNILWGWLSDRSAAHGNGRRHWVAAGLIATALSFVPVVLAASPLAIVLAIVAFQAAVNMLLAPLMALMAEEIPDAQKGLGGGLLALAAPVASALSAGLVGAAMLGEASRLAIVALAMLLCLAPLLLTRPVILAPLDPPREAEVLRGDLVIAWAARLLVQVSGAVLSLYLVYYFQSVAPGLPPLERAGRVGQLLTIAYIVPLPVAVLAGRLSDRIGRRKPFLFGAAAVAALGLIAMAVAHEWTAAALGFGIYAVGSAVFLALHSGFAMQLLPNPARRGRDLGLLNLANTVPILLGPSLTWLLATPDDFGAVMVALAMLSLAGGTAVLAIRGRR